MANSTSMSDVLRAIKEKSASLASGTTSARDMVYIAKGMESLYGADMLMGMLEKAGKPASVQEITESTDHIDLSVEDVSRDIVTIRNPADSSRRAYKEFAAANIVTSDIFKLTFTGLGPNGTGTAEFTSAGGATPSEEQVVDEFVSRINNDANWVVYTGGQTINYTVSRSSGTKADGASGDVFYIDGVERPEIKLQKGNTYVFDVSDSSLNNYEFGFQTDTTGGAQFLTGVTQSAAAQGTAGSTLTVVVPNDAPSTLWYADGDNATQADRYLMGNNVNVDPSETFTVYERAVVASRDGTTDNLKLESLYSGADYNFSVTASTTLTSGSTATWGEVTAVALDGRDRIHRRPYIDVVVPKYGFSTIFRNEINAELHIRTSGDPDSRALIVEACKSKDAVKVFAACDGEYLEEVFTINGNTTPTTTKGDMEVNYGTGLGLQRLPIGDHGDSLSVSSDNLPTWVPAKGQSGDDLFRMTQSEIDWVDNYGNYDTYIELPPRTTEYFSGMRFNNPWSVGSYYDMHNGHYSGFWYKTNDKIVHRMGHSTGYTKGDETNDYFHRAISFPWEFRNKEPMYYQGAYGWGCVVFDDGSAVFAGANDSAHMGWGNATASTSWSISTRWDGSSADRQIKKVMWGGGNSSYSVGVILAEDGSLWTAGRMYNGVGGHGNTSTQNSWTQIQALSNVTIDNFWIGGGDAHWIYAWDDTNGQMYAWGSNHNGQCSVNNTTGTISTPTQLVNWPTGKTPKSVHLTGWNSSDNTTTTNTSMILMTDGTVYGCGNNSYHKLSIGNTTQKQTLVQVGVSGSGIQLNGSSNATTVVRMWQFTQTAYGGFLARMKDGSTVAWGYNGAPDWQGRGNQSSDNYPTEVVLVTGVTDLKQVMMRGTQGNSASHKIVALTDQGDLWTSGYNHNGWGGVGDSGDSFGNVTPHGYQSGFQWRRPFMPQPYSNKVVMLSTWGYSTSNIGWLAVHEDNAVSACGHTGHYVTPNGDNYTTRLSQPWKCRIGTR
jgi:hypothetical protein